MFKNVSNIASIKTVAVFYLKYKAELDLRHVPASEMMIFATKAVLPKGSTLDRGLGYTLEDC